MTRDEILNMEAGREMDDCIATSVMGWDIHAHKTHYIKDDGKSIHLVICGDFQPSSDISSAWQVIEKITILDKNDCGLITTARGWSCEFELGSWPMIHANAETAPLAICRAALLAVMEK